MCVKKKITLCNSDCKLYEITKCVNNINEFIEAHKSNLDRFIFYFNTDYYYLIECVLNLDLIVSEDIRITPLLENHQICVIIDRKMLDWGDVNINDIGRE
jgi:hypothetical protein